MAISKYELRKAMKDAGIVFDGAKDFIVEGMAVDAAITSPNVGVPAVFTAYVDPSVVEILTAPRNARLLFGETRKGDWTTSSAIFKAVEITGSTAPYTDYGNEPTADVNVVYPERDNYVFQTTIRYGEREAAVASRATIDLISEKQRSAAEVLDIDANKFYLRGVVGKRIYGLLNDPNLNADISPTTVGTATQWADKTTIQIYDDVIKLFGELATNSAGRITIDSDPVLAAPSAVMVMLGKSTDYGKSVIDILKNYFTNISFVTLPELANVSGNSVLLAARTVDGAPVAELGYSEKMRSHQLIPELSSYKQKFSAGTYGAIVLRPFAIQIMSGV